MEKIDLESWKDEIDYINDTLEDLADLKEDLSNRHEDTDNIETISTDVDRIIEIREEIAKNIKRLQKSANVVSTLDVLTSFAVVAEDMNYCMPKVNSQKSKTRFPA